MFRVEPQDVTARAGEDVALQCQASGEPVPTVEWLRAGQPLRASRRLRTLPDGSLWLQRVEARDAGAYECVAHNLLGSATARAVLAVRGTGCPRSDRGGQRRDLLVIGDVCVVYGGHAPPPPALPATRIFSLLKVTNLGGTSWQGLMGHLPYPVLYSGGN